MRVGKGGELPATMEGLPDGTEADPLCEQSEEESTLVFLATLLPGLWFTATALQLSEEFKLCRRGTKCVSLEAASFSLPCLGVDLGVEPSCRCIGASRALGSSRGLRRDSGVLLPDSCA